VEWPEKAAGLLPDPDIEVKLDIAGEGRIATLTALTPRARSELEA